MEDILLSVLKFAYGSVAPLTLLAYWPTIVDLHRHKKPSANISTYVLWTAASSVGLLYGFFLLHDPLFLFVAGANFFANAIVLFLRLRLPR